MADQLGHYVPRAKETTSANAYLASMRANQHTGLIDPALMIKASKMAATASRDGEDLIYWLEMGPDNMGGRATSIVYNKSNMNEVYVGSMGGGVFYTWNLGISWHQVGDNLMVSCMAQAEDGTIYVGTGDCFDAATNNGLVDLGYDNSFVGTGLYAIKNNEMTPVASTAVTEQDDSWAFINDIAILNGNKLLVATTNGLRYSADNGATWAFVKDTLQADITGNVTAVKVSSDNTLIAASVEGMLYMGTLDAGLTCHSAASEELDENNNIVAIATAAGLLDVAIAPSNPKVIYVSLVGANGNHTKLYATENGGETWRVILPAVNANFGHQLYESKGLFNHGLVVDPANENALYVTGLNLWRLDRPVTDPDGYYLATKLSDGAGSSFNMYSANYLHAGVNKIAFDPRNDLLAYIATDGGIYKATGTTGSPYFTYENCNRGYNTTRCFNVAPTDKGTRLVAGLLDHGPILLNCAEGTNVHQNNAVPLYPYNAPAYYGIFNDDYNAGFCAVSTMNPNAFIVTTKDGAINRTESAGEDYDISNFLTNEYDDLADEFSFSGFRMPIAMWETYNDTKPLDTVWYSDTIPHTYGTTVMCFSKNAGYPFEYKLTQNVAANDTIPVLDPVTSILYVADGNALYMTREAIRFNVAPYWYKITALSGTPSCIAVSNDGDMVYVGTRSGGLIRVKNPRSIADETLPEIEVSEISLGTDQCVTSVAFTSNDKGLVVTLGNFGNTTYVMYSANADAAEPTFTSKQGNLAEMPVYSSVIVATAGDNSVDHVLIGTEHGIYRCKSIATDPTWTLESANMGDVPVMDLKQQTVTHETLYVPTWFDTLQVNVAYAEPNNVGIVYAATYGRGLFRCETYRKTSFSSVPEAAVTTSTLKMYPNPVSTEATVNFELNQKATVTCQVFDMTGRMVKVMSLGTLNEGNHETKVSVEGLAKGAYVLRLNAGRTVRAVKFMVF